MMRLVRSAVLVGFLFPLPRLGSSSLGDDQPKPEAPLADSKVDFARDIRPILEKNCFACHGAEKQKSGLRLDRKAQALAGGDSGKAIVPGKADDSPLVERIESDDPTLVMP